MGTFRTLSAEEVEELLTGYGLAGYRSHRAVAAGTINTNLAIELAGAVYFLRVNEGKALADVAREATIVDHLAARGVPTPRPLRARSGEPWLVWRGLYISLFPWVAGRVLARAEVEPAHARQAGAALARLHRAGEDFPDTRPGRYEPDEIARRFAAIEGVAAGDPDAGRRRCRAGPRPRPAGRQPRRRPAARAHPRRSVHRQRALRRGGADGPARLRAGLLGTTRLRPGCVGPRLRLRARRLPRRRHAGLRRRLHRGALPDGAGAGGLRRRAALRRLPLRRHPHHRRVPAAERRRPAGQGLPPLSPAAARDRAPPRPGRPVRRDPRPCAPWRCTCGASPCARCPDRRSGCPCPSVARG